MTHSVIRIRINLDFLTLFENEYSSWDTSMIIFNKSSLSDMVVKKEKRNAIY